MAHLKRRKILVAALGVATVSYAIGCADDIGVTSGNLPGPRPFDGGNPDAHQNLPPPGDDDDDDASTDAQADAQDASPADAQPDADATSSDAQPADATPGDARSDAPDGA